MIFVNVTEISHQSSTASSTMTKIKRAIKGKAKGFQFNLLMALRELGKFNMQIEECLQLPLKLFIKSMFLKAPDAQ
jgi:hypothetical protein